MDDVVAVSGAVGSSLTDECGHQPEEDFSGLPLDALLTHKNWKARKEGFDKVRDDPMRLKQHVLEKVGKLVGESNASAQEALFDVFAALVSVSDDDELDILSGAPLKAVVDKGITGRPKAVQASSTFICDLVGIGKHLPAINALLAAFSHKTPKNRLAAVQLCSQLVGDYGVHSFPTKAIFKVMQPLFNDANAQVRKEALSLCCQCYRFMGAGIKKYFSDLRDVQLQELEKLFEGVAVGEVPRKHIRGQEQSTPMKPTEPLAGHLHNSVTSNGLDDASYEVFEEAPVLSKLSRNFYRVALDKSAKWQERVAMVQDNLLPLLAAPKIRQKDDYHELASLVKEFLLDPQAPLMLIGFKCIQEFARSLRAAFAPHARIFLNPLFDKMKDKKTSVVEHITTTLETLIQHKCITLDQCQEDIELATQSRVPNQRLALTHWLIRLTEKLDRAQFVRLSRAQSTFTRLINDEKVEIRNAGLTLVARLVQLFGEGPFQTLWASLEEKQRARLVAATSNMPGPLPATPSGSPAKKTARMEACSGPSLRVPAPAPRSMSAGALPSGCAPHGAVRSSSSLPRTASPDQRRQAGHHVLLDDAVALESTLPPKDEALRLILGLTGGDTALFSALRSKDWSGRHAGVVKLRAVVDGWTEKACTQYLDAVVVCLRVDPGWRESIFQVFQAVLGVIQELITRATTVSPGAAYAVIAGTTARLTEAKNRQAVRDVIGCLARSQGLAFVMRHMITVVATVRTPRLTQECNEFMTALLHAFPAVPVDARSVVDYTKQYCFDHSVQTVRSSAIALLVALRHHAGPIVDNYLSAFAPPAVRCAYEEALALSGCDVRPVASSSSEVQRPTPSLSPSRMQHMQKNHHPRNQSRSPARPIAQKPCSAGGGAGAAGSSTAEASQSSSLLAGTWRTQMQLSSPHAAQRDENEENPGRADVSAALTQLARQMAQPPDWRVRLDAVRRVEELLTSHHRCIAAGGVSDIFRALRGRFDESNKNFVCDVLRVMSLLVEAAGDVACRPGLRAALPNVLGMLGDQKAALREEATRVAYCALACLGIEPMLQYIAKPLSAESHMCNQIALEVLERGLQGAEQDAAAGLSKPALQALVMPVVRLCMSRISEVRAAAERVVGLLLSLLGDEPVLRAVHNLRPAEQQSVRASIERQLQLYLRDRNEEDMRPAAPTTGAPVVTASAPASAPASASASASAPVGAPGSSRLPAGQAPHSPRSPVHTSGRGEAPLSAMRPKAAPVGFITVVTRSPMKETYQQQVTRQPPSQPQSQPSSQPQSQHFTAGSSADELLPIQEIMVGLRSASTATAAAACAEFMRRLQNGEDCGTPEMIQVMVERLYENTKNPDTELATGLIGCLKAIFQNTRCAQRCHSSLLFRMIGTIFDCLLAETFSIRETLIKALNNMTLKLLEGCPANDVFSALMSCMTRYSSNYIATGKKMDLKYIQVTVKCLMRIDFDAVSPDNVVLCCHEYLLQHPPSSFRNLDDLSIRTVKTILQDVSRRCGSPLRATADQLVGSQNLVTHFIRACLETRDRSQKSRGEVGSAPDAARGKVECGTVVIAQERKTSATATTATATAAAEQQQQQTRHVDPRAPCGPDEKSLAIIFSRVRNHVTSTEGLTELYNFLKDHPRCPEFDRQFERCSEAFRSYIKRKIERQAAEDPMCPPGFVLPDVLRLAS